MKRVSMSCLFVLVVVSAGGALAQQGNPDRAVDTNVVNTPDVSVVNVPDVVVVNDSSEPITVRSEVRRTPILCVVPSFSSSGSKDATCVGPAGSVTPVPTGFFLAITDIVASSQEAVTAGQAVVRVTSKNQAGTTFGAGVPLILKSGETQSLHFQSPVRVLPGGRTPLASVSTNVGDVFPVEVNFTGYLVAAADLGL